MTSTLWEWLPWVLHALHLTERASGTGKVVVEENKDQKYLHLGPRSRAYLVPHIMYVVYNGE